MQEERYGTRSLVYSAWHRRYSTQRYVGIEAAQRLAMVDIDCALWVEVDDRTREPLALIETAQDVGQEMKPATITRNLARRAGIAAYCALYAHSQFANPASTNLPDIATFRVKRLWPQPEYTWKILTPKEWADGLLLIRAYGARKVDRELADSQRVGQAAYVRGTQ
jgi:hypothetical protein